MHKEYPQISSWETNFFFYEDINLHNVIINEQQT